MKATLKTPPKQKAFTNDQLIDAANQHALSVLGEDQFKSNPEAAKMIANDFIKGALYVLDVFTDADQDLVNLVDKDLEV
ncbi:hypothetical protein AAW12_16045 [Sphingobacterium sp. Ag1]|uniref:hypothetical protein n=1 Tax=Sphingobacterium sp. Ag1 TaxID=1643451 RepID=UPI00062807E8|nr:hypothetical protein [Sphingobacterium sp. Ag1]KKO90586.1 hypothetical protein AAW12_16045 [Sphingobacterium sp. Ag1]